MTDQINVSVIIPCYNDGKYLAEAIESVDLGRNADAEVIIVDDGSNDPETQMLLKQLIGERIRVYYTNRSGPSGARNEGIRHANGRYILPLDADDRIEAVYIPQAKAVLDQNEAIGVVYCHADLFGKACGLWKLPDYSLDRMLLDNVVFVTAMFRKTDWEKIGGFRTDMKNGLEDYDFFLGILELGKTIHQLPEVLFHYRIKKQSRTTGFLANKEIVKQAYQAIYDHHSKLYQQYAALHARVLREALVEQQYKLRWLREIKAFAGRMVSRITHK